MTKSFPTEQGTNCDLNENVKQSRVFRTFRTVLSSCRSPISGRCHVGGSVLSQTEAQIQDRRKCLKNPTRGSVESFTVGVTTRQSKTELFAVPFFSAMICRVTGCRVYGILLTSYLLFS